MLMDGFDCRLAVLVFPIKEYLVVLTLASEEVFNVRVIGLIDEIGMQGVVDLHWL